MIKTKPKSWYYGTLTVVGLLLVVVVARSLTHEKPNWTTTVTETGDVVRTVSVSGLVEANQLAKLSFPGSGPITGLYVKVGDKVEPGQVLATLAENQLAAELNEARSAYQAATANLSQVLRGPRPEAISVTTTNLDNAKTNLTRITAEENRKVQNAKRSLLSTGLAAYSSDPNERSTPPTVSGTYTCEANGTYTINVYNSGTKSGFSYSYSGLESGNAVVSTDQPAPLGECGLYLLFTPGDLYGNSTWTIELPNTRSSSYATLNNAYELTLTQADNAIKAATAALRLAEDQANLNLAPARSEEVTGASATAEQARARIAAAEARLANLSISAPFSGTVTAVEATLGEVSGPGTTISVLADDGLLLKARIPEIDITKLALNQKITAVFDARDNETLTGELSYISPIATQIDGVAYFETHIELDQNPDWLRAGLNADIDIILEERSDVTRLPRRYIIDTPEGSVVLTPNGNRTATTSVMVDFIGNDGYAAISGLPAGTTVIAP
jgi:HlyD family secretion protein